MDISALTRSVVKPNYALISPDGHINSTVPGWTNCTVNIIISKEMGADFTQTLITCRPGASLSGQTKQMQAFFYLVSGTIDAKIDTTTKTLTEGQYVYIPRGMEYHFGNAADKTQLLSFHKTYEPLEAAADKPLENTTAPGTIFGDTKTIPANDLADDKALRIQVLLPDNPQFDLAINILIFDPGAHLPLVETHIMEHGLLYLQGQGIYRLGQDWYPVKKGDCIWMAPYCQQWFTAMGKEPAVYIYYKNVNRFIS
jgi:(S)-ureidoglycine aminohydrolase